MPTFYLLKTEPSTYSFAQLQKDKQTIWDGVNSPAGKKHLREMQPGANLIIYETAEVKSAVGTAKVISVDISDPSTPRVEISAGKALAKPVTLAEMKANKIFHQSPIAREPRLSVVPLTEAQYKFIIG